MQIQENFGKEQKDGWKNYEKSTKDERSKWKQQEALSLTRPLKVQENRLFLCITGRPCCFALLYPASPISSLHFTYDLLHFL